MVISGRRSRVHKGLLHGTARGPEAVCRAAGRIPRAAAVLSVAAAMEMAATVLGGASGGLKGVCRAARGGVLRGRDSDHAGRAPGGHWPWPSPRCLKWPA